jgi:hypothetical protein
MIVAVFLFHHRLFVVVMSGFLPITVSIMEVGGGYPLPRCETVRSFLTKGYLLWRGRRPCTITPSHMFPAKFPYLNYMGSKIWLSCYWAYAIYFGALVQSKKFPMFLRKKVSISNKNNSGIFPIKKVSDLFSQKFLIFS